MSYVVISDVHLHNWSPFSFTCEDGTNNRLKIILEAIKESTAPLKPGDRLYITGDLFHVRGHISPTVLNPTIDLFKSIIASGIIVRIIPGNHDLESKDTSRLSNAVQALESIGCDICNEVKIYEDDQVIMVPWFDSLDDLRRVITDVRTDLEGYYDPHPMNANSAEAEYSLMIHAPLNGVLPIPENGLSPEELNDLGYKRVFCGHYHNHKCFEGGVFSVGALTHQTWSDVNTKAGFILVNENDMLTHHETSAPKFVDYEDVYSDLEALELCEGNYVRVKLGEATDKEIRQIREEVASEYKAAGVKVQSTPKPVGVQRSSSVSSGASIEKSIEEWIGGSIEDNNFAKEVNSTCMDILSEVSSGD